ncbi:MAG: hypothetical protein U0800_12105 [Isosphaeraceae bacterium]
MDGRYLSKSGPVDERVLVIDSICNPPDADERPFRLPERVDGDRRRYLVATDSPSS